MNIGLHLLKTKIHRDSRGMVVELVKPKDVLRTKFGQIYLSIAFPGKTKGNHYHTKKSEYVCVVAGKMKAKFKDLKTGKTKEMILNSKKLKVISIPPFVVHSFTNIGYVEARLLVYSDQKYNRKKPDTVKFNLS